MGAELSNVQHVVWVGLVLGWLSFLTYRLFRLEEVMRATVCAVMHSAEYAKRLAGLAGRFGGTIVKRVRRLEGAE